MVYLHYTMYIQITYYVFIWVLLVRDILYFLFKFNLFFHLSVKWGKMRVKGLGQCDQIGRFLKVLATNFITKVAQIFLVTSGDFCEKGTF